MITHLKKYFMYWIGAVMLLTVTIPQARDGTFKLLQIAKAEEVEQKQKQINDTLRIVFQITQTQNKILDELAKHSTGVDSVAQKIYIEILRDQIDSLKHLITADSTK